ncbi:helix-turn-helix domain-containing protein [Trinickia dinghuensis]|uniref:XRE family transcriptional regulator n=1 Tax=Trinickia dinghuensis TaxID=2291023 RepID=A0A3D8K7F1_9BURK|nr:helix-turn-helix transcriptional regulator [Trinickia dinghuensis]RDV00837.1 XRE family transcriptional regulator [Trinickia dinghuensis]
MHFTDQLVTLRARRRMSLATIGSIVGMAVPNLSAVLRGRGDTKGSTLDSIASALGAEWVLVPKEHREEVRRIVDGAAPGPAFTAPAPRTIEIFSEKK